MAKYRGKDAAVLNTAMHRYIPETAGVEYGNFPMQNPRWYEPNEKVPYGTQKGQPCFIKTGISQPEEDGNFKQGYAWGPGAYGWGYYHLLTKSCWKILYSRVLNGYATVSGDSGGCCSCFQPKDPRTILPVPKKGVLTTTDINDMRVLFHARANATKGHDGVAVSDQLEVAQNDAQAWFIEDQGFALQDAHTIGKAVKNQTIKR